MVHLININYNWLLSVDPAFCESYTYYFLRPNESIHRILYNQALPNINSHERSRRRGHSWEKNALGLLFYYFFFCDSIPVFPFFPFLSPVLVYAFFLCILCVKSLSRACLMWVGWHSKCTMVNWPFSVRNISKNVSIFVAMRAVQTVFGCNYAKIRYGTTTTN